MREKKKNKDQIDPNQQDKSKENENAQKAMEHISENVDDNDKQQPLERNKVTNVFHCFLCVFVFLTFVLLIRIDLIFVFLLLSHCQTGP
jgi:Flp pilus assembly protein TadB